MELVLHLATGLMIVVGAGVGLKLLVRAWRERQLTDFSIALGLFCYAVMAQTGRYVVLALGPDAAPALQFGATSYRVVGFWITLAMLAIFNWRVFGQASFWRRAFAATLILSGSCGAVGVLRGFWVMVHGGAASNPLWQLPVSIAFAAVFVWTAAESLAYYGRMRKRQALGLADPVVTNRFLVWGAGAGLSTALTLVTVAMTASGGANSPLSQAAATTAGLVNAAVWWISFSPPAAYLRWVRGANAGVAQANRGD